MKCQGVWLLSLYKSYDQAHTSTDIVGSVAYVEMCCLVMSRHVWLASGSTQQLLIAGLLFDWLYPAHFPVISLCLEAWAETPEVTTALLRFMAEFVMNKNTRLAFDSSSPNGILLFREVSKVWQSLTFSVLLTAITTPPCTAV